MMETSNAMIQEDVIDQLLLVMDIPPAVMDMMKQIVVNIMYLQYMYMYVQLISNEVYIHIKFDYIKCFIILTSYIYV